MNSPGSSLEIYVESGERLVLVQWQADLETGAELVDAQHKEIFNRVNALLTAMQQGKGRAEVVAVIDFLGKYVVSHFTAEEGLMRQNGYPEYTAHQQLHKAFVTDFADLKREFEANGSSSLLVIQVQRRVIDWLMNHIIREDKRIAEFLRNKA